MGEKIAFVPKTDTGGQVEYTKTIGRRRVKELGKKARRNFGRCLALYHALARRCGAAANECSATVYQKHRSLQTRKGKYRG